VAGTTNKNEEQQQVAVPVHSNSDRYLIAFRSGLVAYSPTAYHTGKWIRIRFAALFKPGTTDN
jgi:hypothetical protein